MPEKTGNVTITDLQDDIVVSNALAACLNCYTQKWFIQLAKWLVEKDFIRGPADRFRVLDRQYHGGGSPTLAWLKTLSVEHPEKTIKTLKDGAELLQRHDLIDDILRDIPENKKIADLDSDIKNLIAIKLEMKMNNGTNAANWSHFAQYFGYDNNSIQQFKTSAVVPNEFSPTMGLIKMLCQEKPLLPINCIILWANVVELEEVIDTLQKFVQGKQGDDCNNGKNSFKLMEMCQSLEVIESSMKNKDLKLEIRFTFNDEIDIDLESPEVPTIEKLLADSMRSYFEAKSSLRGGILEATVLECKKVEQVTKVVELMFKIESTVMFPLNKDYSTFKSEKSKELWQSMKEGLLSNKLLDRFKIEKLRISAWMEGCILIYVSLWKKDGECWSDEEKSGIDGMLPYFTSVAEKVFPGGTCSCERNVEKYNQKQEEAPKPSGKMTDIIMTFLIETSEEDIMEMVPSDDSFGDSMKTYWDGLVKQNNVTITDLVNDTEVLEQFSRLLDGPCDVNSSAQFPLEPSRYRRKTNYRRTPLALTWDNSASTDFETSPSQPFSPWSKGLTAPMIIRFGGDSKLHSPLTTEDKRIIPYHAPSPFIGQSLQTLDQRPIDSLIKWAESMNYTDTVDLLRSLKDNLNGETRLQSQIANIVQRLQLKTSSEIAGFNGSTLEDVSAEYSTQ
uniref:Uncharacterized protein n=1 Tax=Clytia hemisphaerica TaxID=252671 RepID=A0A7M5TQL5_9CNID